MATCQCLKKDQTQCQRTVSTKSGNNSQFCWQHQNCSSKIGSIQSTTPKKVHSQEKLKYIPFSLTDRYYNYIKLDELFNESAPINDIDMYEESFAYYLAARGLNVKDYHKLSKSELNQLFDQMLKHGGPYDENTFLTGLQDAGFKDYVTVKRRFDNQQSIYKLVMSNTFEGIGEDDGYSYFENFLAGAGISKETPKRKLKDLVEVFKAEGYPEMFEAFIKGYEWSQK